MPPYFAVKESVFPFRRFPGVDPILGPEMAVHRRGHGHRRGLRPGLRQGAAGRGPGPAAHRRGALFSVKDPDKPLTWSPGQGLSRMGFQVYATAGTAQYLRKHGLPVEQVYKIREGRPQHHRPHQEPRDRPAGQHPRGPLHPGGLLLHPPGRPGIQYALHHHPGRGQGHPGRHPGHKGGKLKVKSLQEYHEMMGKKG